MFCEEEEKLRHERFQSQIKTSRERHRERERHTHRERETERERDRETQRKRDTERERERERDREREVMKGPVFVCFQAGGGKRGLLLLLFGVVCGMMAMLLMFMRSIAACTLNLVNSAWMFLVVTSVRLR